MVTRRVIQQMPVVMHCLVQSNSGEYGSSAPVRYVHIVHPGAVRTVHVLHPFHQFLGGKQIFVIAGLVCQIHQRKNRVSYPSMNAGTGGTQNTAVERRMQPFALVGQQSIHPLHQQFLRIIAQGVV